MKKLIPILFILMLLSSCKKDIPPEPERFCWRCRYNYYDGPFGTSDFHTKCNRSEEEIRKLETDESYIIYADVIHKVPSGAGLRVTCEKQ